MSEILDGKKIAAEIRQKVKEEVSLLARKPSLAVILVGNDPASEMYVNMKDKKCKEVGIKSLQYKLYDDAKESEILNLVDQLNNDPDVNGILIQMPLPSHIDSDKVMNFINPLKDVDGFNAVNIGRNIQSGKGFIPCTPKGVIKLLDAYGIDLEGKDAVVIGNSVVVGNPVAQLLLSKGATVTTCHIKTKDLKKHTLNADIIVSAVGKKNLVTADMVKDNVVIVDVGIVSDSSGIYGDVDFEEVN